MAGRRACPGWIGVDFDCERFLARLSRSERNSKLELFAHTYHITIGIQVVNDVLHWTTHFLFVDAFRTGHFSQIFIRLLPGGSCIFL